MTVSDPWPHFDPDERTETILHLQARADLEQLNGRRSNLGTKVDRHSGQAVED